MLLIDNFKVKLKTMKNHQYSQIKRPIIMKEEKQSLVKKKDLITN